MTRLQVLRNAQARTLRFLRAHDHGVLASVSRLSFLVARSNVERQEAVARTRAKVLATAAALLAGVAPNTHASTLDFEISAGLNITDKLTGRFSNTDGGFTGPRDTVEFSLVWRSGDWFVKLSHISHLSCGAPFGDCKADQSFKTIDGFSAPNEAFLERIEFGRRFRLFGGF